MIIANVIKKNKIRKRLRNFNKNRSTSNGSLPVLWHIEGYA
jgi:hypothetical protein